MSTATDVAAAAELRRAAIRDWLPALTAIAVVAIVLGAAFWYDVARAVEVWAESTAYNHCYLVLPMALFLLWQRRDVVISVRPQPAPWALLLLLPLGAAWVAAAALNLLEGEQLIVLTMFEVAILAIVGGRTFRALLAPLLFLYFLVPFGGFLVHPLQIITADMSVFGLQHSGIPVFADRFTIEIPEGTFEIVEACAGLRFLIASIVFGCFFATIVYRSRIRRLIFILLSLVVPVVANGIRAYGTILLGHIEGSATAVEADHILYGWLFFSLVTIVLIAIGMSFADRHEDAPPAPVAATGSRRRIGATAGVAALLVLAGPAYFALLGSASGAPAVLALRDPGWSLKADAPIVWLPVIAGADKETVAVYANGGATVSRYIALYRLRSRYSKFTATRNSLTDDKTWRLEDSGRATVTVDGSPVIVAAARIVRPGEHRLVWSFYDVDGRVAPGLLGAKLMQAKAILLGGARFGSFVALSTRIDPAAPAAASAALTRFLQAMGPLRAADIGG